MSQKIKASIIGVTGFTGTEILRILLRHPDIEIAYLVSRQYEDVPASDVFPRLLDRDAGLRVTSTDYMKVAEDSDIVFLGLPNTKSQDVVVQMMGKTKIVDLSADFRLRDKGQFKRFYHEDHKYPKMLGKDFVYGLPEIYRDDIKDSDYVANAGCFALLTQCMLYPFKGKMDSAHVIGISGTTGGGRSPRDPMEHPVLSGAMRSYLVNEHRHIPEILNSTGIPEDKFNFLPSVGPFLRGIFANGFIHTDMSADEAQSFFKDEPFIRMRPEVNMNHVVGTNYCDLHYRPGKDGTVIVQGAIDNLLKGAAGTAVQNMNLMCGLDECAGLDLVTPTYP